MRTLRTHITTPMLQNHIRVGSDCLHTVIVVVFQISNSGIGLVRAKTVTEVQTETVHFVFRQPILQRTGKHLLCRCKSVVPIFIDVIAVRCIDIEPRVVRQIGSVRIEFVHRVETRRMVEHHVNDNGHTAFVALIDERLVHFLRTVRLIRRKIVVGRITPVVVAVKLTNRHQFYRIDTQVLDVIQTFHQAFEGTPFGIVVDPQLINDQVVFIRTLEVQRCVGPLESRFSRLNDRHVSVRAGRIIEQIRIHFLRFVLIIGMQHFLRIQIRDLFLHTIRTLHRILKAVLLTRCQPRQCDPEIIPVLIKLVVRTEFPIGHISNQEHPFRRLRFAGSVGTQGHRCAIRTVIDTVTYSCRTCFLRRCQTCYIIPIGCVRAQSEHTQTNQT